MEEKVKRMNMWQLFEGIGEMLNVEMKYTTLRQKSLRKESVVKLYIAVKGLVEGKNNIENLQ